MEHPNNVTTDARKSMPEIANAKTHCRVIVWWIAWRIPSPSIRKLVESETDQS